MDWPIAPGTVALGTGDRPPASGVPGECSSGNPGGSPVVLPTEIVAAMMNVLYLELINLIQVAGLTNTNTDLGQVAEAVQALAASTPHGSLAYTFGSGTWTPPASVRSVHYRLWGGGGGGGGATDNNGGGGGGGGGAYAEDTIAVTPGTPVSWTVGIGGPGGAAGNNAGTAGGLSIFGTVTAYGGGGGGGAAAGQTNPSVGSGGAVAGSPHINMPGGTGGFPFPAGGGYIGGIAGGSGLNGASPSPNNAAAGHFGIGPGGGGNGSSNNASGGGGAPGLLLLSW